MSYRGVKIGYTIASGKDVLLRGGEHARKLWNAMWWCQIGFNQQLMRQREGKVAKYGDDGEVLKYSRGKREGQTVYSIDYALARRNLPYQRGVKYLRYAGLDKAMRDHPSGRALSDRCFSYTVKEFDVAMQSWMRGVKSRPSMRPPKPARETRTLTFEQGRNAKHLGNFHFRLTVLGGRGKGRHAFIKLMPPPGVKLSDFKTFKLMPNGKCVLAKHVTDQAEACGERCAGIDLGITNLAAVAFDDGESILYSGKGLKMVDNRYSKQVAKTRSKGWIKGDAGKSKSARRTGLDASYRGTRALMIHNLTTDVVNECAARGIGLIAVGKLKGIRKSREKLTDGKPMGKWAKRREKQFNQTFHRWPFAKIVEQIKYKADHLGIAVVEVSEAYTSQQCCCCGEINQVNRVKRGLYMCRNCSFAINADVNGAFNILNKVSPGGDCLPLGVEGDFRALPSPHAVEGIGAVARKAAASDTETLKDSKPCISQIQPTYVAKYDLRNFAITHATC